MSGTESGFVTNVIIREVTVMTLLLMPTFQVRTREQSFLDITVLFKTHIIFCKVCIGKSTFVLRTLRIPALVSPLSNSFCRCTGIVLQNGCQVANRVTDVCDESVMHRVTSEISR